MKHPVNLAYEAATADLNDVNMIDPFHLEAYGETTVNYNRDIEIYPCACTLCSSASMDTVTITSLQQIWVSTWQATVLSTTRSAK